MNYLAIVEKYGLPFLVLFLTQGSTTLIKFLITYNKGVAEGIILNKKITGLFIFLPFLWAFIIGIILWIFKGVFDIEHVLWIASIAMALYNFRKVKRLLG